MPFLRSLRKNEMLSFSWHDQTQEDWS